MNRPDFEKHYLNEHFFCQYCEELQDKQYVTETKIEMIKHNINHGIYKCEQCNYESTNNNEMTAHTKQNHKPKITPQKESDNHLTPHKQPDNNYQCTQCKFTGSLNATLKKHKITRHKTP